MTEKEARKILEEYREFDTDTGETYRYIIQRSTGNDAESFFFECKIEGHEYRQGDILPILAVTPDGDILNLPL